MTKIVPLKTLTNQLREKFEAAQECARSDVDETYANTSDNLIETNSTLERITDEHGETIGLIPNAYAEIFTERSERLLKYFPSSTPQTNGQTLAYMEELERRLNNFLSALERDPQLPAPLDDLLIKLKHHFDSAGDFQSGDRKQLIRSLQQTCKTLDEILKNHAEACLSVADKVDQFLDHTNALADIYLGHKGAQNLKNHISGINQVYEEIVTKLEQHI